MNVRVRYAPSPTGFQHIGGARTALFNYCFARASGGKFLLRVEDTDRERYFDGALEDLYATMKWLGIEWDEGPVVGGPYAPYVQSERSDLYRRHAEELVACGKAYRCYCTPARLERIRKIHEANGMAPGYDRHCRFITPEEEREAVAAGIKPVVRLRIPDDGVVTIHDELLGDITRACKDVSPDPILLKSDGFPTYHLANVIDDHYMHITHVLRAQEWVPSAALHKLLYEAFGWEMPILCHLPMVMGQDGQKLSKRHGSTSVREFIAGGYLPEAVVNYVCLLGWSYDDSREFFSLKELCELFRLDRLNKAPAVFDYKKLEYFNGAYIRKLSEVELKARILPFLVSSGLVGESLTQEEDAVITGAIPLIQERLKLLVDAPPLLRFLFEEPSSYDEADAIPKKMDKDSTVATLKEAARLLIDYKKRSDEELEGLFRVRAEEMGMKINQLLQPVRVAVTGGKVSPPLFGSLRLLSEDVVNKRIKALVQFLGGAW